MRKIEENMVEAVKKRQNWKSGNTEVTVCLKPLNQIVIKVYLHGNEIYSLYEYEDGTQLIYFSLAGWNTVTTRSRLRALGINITQRKSVPLFNGEEVKKNLWYWVS